jgi:hypothetical protein
LILSRPRVILFVKVLDRSSSKLMLRSKTFRKIVTVCLGITLMLQPGVVAAMMNAADFGGPSACRTSPESDGPRCGCCQTEAKDCTCCCRPDSKRSAGIAASKAAKSSRLLDSAAREVGVCFCHLQPAPDQLPPAKPRGVEEISRQPVASLLTVRPKQLASALAPSTQQIFCSEAHQRRSELNRWRL